MKAFTALAVSSAKSKMVVSKDLVEKARGYAQAAKSARTRKEYARDWATFASWCRSNKRVALPSAPQTLALFLAARASDGRKVATIARALAAISQAHRASGLPSPRSEAPVQEVLKGIRRSLGVAQVQKAPLLPADLRAIVEELPDGLLGLRDRSLLLLGFAGAFRRSELVALDVADLTFTEAGLEVAIRRSKTDQEGVGRKVGVPFGRRPETCPVRTTRTWLDAARIELGPIFREVNRHGRLSAPRLSGRSVARIIKRCAELAGLDASKVSGHSLRAGLVTSAAKAGKPLDAIMRQTGHRSVAIVQRYIRDASLFEENAAEDLL